MKKILLAFLLLTAVWGFGQEIPTIVPPSPNAYQMTKYGEIPVNEATGVISVNVPLFNYTAGTVSTPVSLSYTGNGVKVHQPPTIVGMNWALNAGGVITRTIRDKIDESSNNKFYLSKDELNAMNQGNYGTWEDTNTFFGKMYRLGEDLHIQGAADTQADIFTYNFSGYSGSFFFDENQNPHLIKYDKEVKIELIPATAGEKTKFKITTEAGISYYFGGNDATEITRNRWGQGANVSPWVPTSFFLYKIKNWNGDEIYFEYTDEGASFSIQTTPSYTMSRTHGFLTQDPNSSTPNYVNDFVISSTTSNIEYKNGAIKLLYKITNNKNNSYLQFNSESIYFGKAIESIAFYKNNTSLLKKIAFTYYSPPINNNNFSNRFFLKTVSFLDANGVSNDNNYTFEYDNLDGFADVSDFACDHLGYYNGKNSNTNLLPDNIDNELIPNDLLAVFKQHYNNGFFHLADREADFNFAKIGTLTKVIYPTKGYTTFEYESGTDGFKRASQNMNFSLDYLHDSSLVNDIITQTQSFTASIDGTAQVSLSSFSSASRTRFISAELLVQDLTANTETRHYIVVGNPHPDPNPPVTHSSNATFEVINGHNYQLTFHFVNGLDLNGNSTVSFSLLDPNTNLLATAAINYPIQGPVKDALGIRIKRLVSKANPTATPLIKRYYYSNKEDINNSSLEIISPRYLRYDKYDIVKKYSYFDIGGFPGSDFVATDYIHKESILSNNIGAIYEDDSQKKLYPVVTVSFGGDHFENGGEELFFKVYPNTPPYSFYYGLAATTSPYEDSDRFTFANTSNYSWENGTLYKKNTFKKVGANFVLKAKEETHYKIDESKSYTLHNIIIDKNQGIPINYYGSAHNPIEDLKIGLYKTFSKWHAVDKVKTTAYFGTDSIVTTQDYFYDTGWAGIPTRIKTTTSAGDISTQKMYYPDQVTTSSALPGGTISNASYAAMQTLQKAQQHRIASPVQTEDYKNNVLTSRVRTNYKITNGLTLTSKVQAAKGANPLHDAVLYHKYDTHGNPLELSKSGGESICYIWGYNHTKPIAKIVGLAYDQIPSAQRTALANFDYINGSEDSLLVLLDNLRNALPNAMVSTFTYKPLIGLSTMTDAKGQTSKYYYDSFNRLQYVKDAQGHILKENEYHYRDN